MKNKKNDNIKSQDKLDLFIKSKELANKQKNNYKELKKNIEIRKNKIKIGSEDFIVENFKDEDDYDEDSNKGTKIKEIVLKNEDLKNPKIIKQKVFLNQKLEDFFTLIRI